MTVSRRFVLKSIVSAAMAPLVNLRPHIPDERLMQAFCGQSSFYFIQRPFGVGALTYATDQYAMIRAELAGRDEVGEVQLPPVESAWTEHWRPACRWQPLTPDDLIPTGDHSGRNGFVYTKCPECGNRRKSLGEYYPPMDTPEQRQELASQDYEVDDNTIRDPSCPACGGMDYVGLDEVSICGQALKAYDLRRILALPNAEVCSSASGRSILFRADGFQGVAMGLIR